MEIRNFRYKARIPRKQRSGIRRLLISLVSVIFLVGNSAFIIAAIQKPLQSITATSSALATLPAENIVLPWPSGAQAAIGSLDDGVLAQSTSAETPRPTASIAKVITALAVMKQKPISPGTSGANITLDAVDVGYYVSYLAQGGSVVPVMAGEQLSQLQALEALLLSSSNNMADSLVRWAFGSMDAYIAYANVLVKEMGLNTTIVADASGFSPLTRSTASDLVILGQHALRNEIISKIVSKREAIIPVAGVIRSTNQLLTDTTAVGIKTGYTVEAGYCLLFAASRPTEGDHSEIIIGVIMGAASMPSVYQSAAGLLSSATSGFATREVIKANSKVGVYQSPWGSNVSVSAASSMSYYGWKGKDLVPEATITPVEAPQPARTRAGVVVLKGFPEESSVLLHTDAPLTEPNLLWKLKHYF